MSKVDPQGAALRLAVQGFARRFGLLSEDRTPCGQPLQLSHAHALMLLLESQAKPSPRVVHQRDLATALGLDKSSVARLCARMERSGHIAQKRSDVDGRAREVALTAKGERVAREVDKASRQRFARVLAAIPPNRRNGVVEALKLLEAAALTLEVA